MSARDDLYAVICARATDHDGALKLLDAYAAEVRREDAARLLADRAHYSDRAVYRAGITHAAGLLAAWANERGEAS